MVLNQAVVRAKLCQFLEEKAREMQRRVVSECLCKIEPRAHAVECKIYVEPTKDDRHGVSITSTEIYENLLIDYRISYPESSKYIELKAIWYVWETKIIWW